jgi:ubiquinone/menaquinone biosynthesis C-methylase UbiE
MSVFDNGAVYRYIIDPILSPFQDIGINMLPRDKTIIDIACGTGSFAFKLALKSKHVTGIDYSESMIRVAMKRKDRTAVHNVDFIMDDAVNLNEFRHNEFDIATLSMAIHQFSQDMGFQVICESIRIAREILIIDYSYPLTPDIYRYIVHLVERIAGKEHYRNFRSYIRSGGMTSYLKDTGVKTIVKKSNRNGIFTIFKCQK